MKVRFGCALVALLSACFAHGAPLTLPDPPHQRTPWQPSATVPTNLLSAVTTLFEQGFPDPRGCEYREIEVEVSGVWGDASHFNFGRERGELPDGKSSSVRTRGWVLPDKSGQSKHFAICWNGLIYPAMKVGDAVDLHAEATNLTKAGGRRFNNAVGETRSVFATNSFSTRVLLLLRCGETEAALKNWSPEERLASEIRARNRRPNSAASGDASYDPYLQLAGDWAWALFDRTICTHMRGDVPLALATARKLVDAQPKIEAEAAKRGFPRQKFYDSLQQGKEKPYLDFLEQVPQLLADLERREREGGHVSVIESGLTNIANQTARIMALIRDLDLVQARQWGQPGGVNTGESPIVDALIHEGDSAVEPLLDCLETDKRLTRSVSFGRDFFRGRNVIPVTSAANTAVRSILQANFGSTAEIRAYWKKYGALKLEDRWHAILRDDTAGMGRWLEAAGIITQPENIRKYPGTGFRVESPAPTNAPSKLRGEVLRDRKNPSVAELFARRAIEISPTNIAAYDLSAAGEMGLQLAAWDADAAMPVLKVLAERARAVLEYSAPPQRGGAPPMGLLIARLSMARAENGDDAALGDYADWLKTTRPEQLEYSLAESVAPLCRFPTNIILRAAADELFGNTNSAWGRLPWSRAGLFNPIESDLVLVPAFRRLLARELDRKEVCGHVECRTPNYVSFTLTNETRLNSGRSAAFPENERPAEGAKAEVRWCDWIAAVLANRKQIPFFNPFAPVESRDQAIESAKALLNQPPAL